MMLATSLLPEAVIHILFQFIVFPNRELVKSSAARILGKCNCHDRLNPLMMSWMKTSVDSTISFKTMADLEFPSIEMVAALSNHLPLEKLLDPSFASKSKELQQGCIAILDCLVRGGSNIAHMLSERKLSESGGILMKLLRALKSPIYPLLQMKAVDALYACRLHHWKEVWVVLVEVFSEGRSAEIRGKIAGCILHHDTEKDIKIEGLYALRLWLEHKNVDMRSKAVAKCRDLKVFNPENVIIISSSILFVLNDSDSSIRLCALRAMFDGGLSGDSLLRFESTDIYDVTLALLAKDDSHEIKCAAARCILNGVATESKSCIDVTQLLGGWVQDLAKR